MPRILLIEDDKTIAGAIINGLKQQAIQTEWLSCANLGKQAICATNDNQFDAVLLDLGLPNGDGMNVLHYWRQHNINVPVLIITARDAISERVAGLNAGADDYLVKPFALDEMTARLQALIRRSQGRSQSLIHYGDVSFDPNTQQVYFKDKLVDLTAKEIAVLYYMLSYPKQIHSRASLEDKVYGWQQEVESNAIEVHVHHLRKKLGNEFILTKRGIGYYLKPLTDDN